VNTANATINTPGTDCQKLDPNATPTDPNSFIVNGNQIVPANVNSVELRPFVLKSTNVSPPYATPSPSSPPILNPTVSETSILCFNTSDPRSCPNRDLVKLEFSIPTGAYPITVTAQYFANFPGHSISHTVRLSSTSGSIYIAREKKIMLTYSTNGVNKTVLIDTTSTTTTITDTSGTANPLPMLNYPTGSQIFSACLPANTASSLNVPSTVPCTPTASLNYITLTLNFIGSGF
jgi:hypothetical protein